MIEVKQLLYLLLYILELCVCGSFMKRNYRFFTKIRVESTEKQTLALNTLVYFVLCIKILVNAVCTVMVGVQ